MSFLNGGLLAALSLISIPLIIHLINRRRAVEHRFAAFEFLMRSKIDTHRKFKLKYLLLLLTRIALILCIVLAAAMPVLFGHGPHSSGDAGKILVVLDNSASMHYVEDSLTGYTAGLRFLRNYLEREKASFVKVIPSVGLEKDFDLKGFSGETDKALGEFPLTCSAGRLDQALKRAEAELSRDDAYARLVIVSDFSVSDFRHVSDSLFSRIRAGVVLVRTSDDSMMRNRGILSLTVKTVPESHALSVTPFLFNQSGKPLQEFPLGLFLGSRNFSNGFVSVEAGRGVEKEFLVDGALSTALPGEIRIAQDDFGLDDTRYFVYTPLPPIRTVAVDGDQGAHYTASETFFLERALGQRGGGEGLHSVITPSGLTPAALKGRRVLFLCNTIPGPEAMELVSEFVKEGGGLFVSLGDKVETEAFNASLGPIFKRMLRDKKSGLGHKAAVKSFLQVADPTHPAVAILNRIQDPEKYVFNDLFLLEPAPETGTRTLLRTSGGEPLLLAGNYGKGTLFLYLSSLDMAWNDFPLRPFFLPFIHEAVNFLAGAREQVIRDTVYAGDTLKIRAKTSVRIDEPDGRRLVAEAHNGLVLFTDTRVPGHYRFSSDNEGERWVAVNLNPLESAPERLSSGQIAGCFAGSAYVLVQARQDVRAESLLPKPLWHYFLLAAALLVLIEALLLLPERKRKS